MKRIYIILHCYYDYYGIFYEKVYNFYEDEDRALDKLAELNNEFASFDEWYEISYDYLI